MADTKITALAAITTVDPANDVLPIVDVSNNSMAASGTTCRVTTNQLLQANAIASLASVTITGDLTVDTTTLVVNPAGYPDRVGIGTATPARPLDIVGSFQSSLGWVLTGTPAGLGAATRYIGGASTTDSWYFNALTGGNHLWAFGESLAMTLNSTGLGVGVAPGSGKIAARAGTAATGNSLYADNIDGTYNPWIQIQHSSAGIKIFNSSSFGGSSNNLIFGNGTTSETMRIDSSGNVGIGAAIPNISASGKALTIAGAFTRSRLELQNTDGGTGGVTCGTISWFNGSNAIADITGAANSGSATLGSLAFSTGGSTRAVVKSTGQVRFVPLAADPSGAEAGDVYYNSTSNKLKCYNGTTWNDLF